MKLPYLLLISVLLVVFVAGCTAKIVPSGITPVKLKEVKTMAHSDKPFIQSHMEHLRAEIEANVSRTNEKVDIINNLDVRPVCSMCIQNSERPFCSLPRCAQLPSEDSQCEKLVKVESSSVGVRRNINSATILKCPSGEFLQFYESAGGAYNYFFVSKTDIPEGVMDSLTK